MSDLTDFLLERIAEDEEVARAALSAHGEDSARAVSDWVVAVAWDFTWGEQHAVDMSPERLLAECTAKRAVVALWEDLATEWMEGGDAGDAVKTCLRHLAAAYSSHPDYRDEWRP